MGRRMKKLVAINADSIESINKETDTSLLLGDYAAYKGMEVFWYKHSNLTYKEGKLYAKGNYLNFKGDLDYKGREFELSNEMQINLEQAHSIIIRQNPPVNEEYLHNTHMLDLLKDVKIINNTQSLRDYNEKMVILKYFKHLMPQTILTSQVSEVMTMLKVYKELVLKPTYLFGGQGIIKIKQGEDKVEKRIKDHISKYKTVFVQEFLREIKEGDRRVFLINYKPVGVLNRRPQKGNFISNTYGGGIAEEAKLNSTDKKISEEVKSFLKEKGIYLAGLDIIGNKLTELNITSPTGLKLISINNKKIYANEMWDPIM